MRAFWIFLLFTTQDALADVYQLADEACFELLIENHLTGSGVVVDATGLALTVAHAVRGHAEIEIRSRQLGRLPAQVVALDLGHDIALLQLPKRDAGYRHLNLARTQPRAGADIYLFGAPIYRHSVLLKGSLAAPDQRFEYLTDLGYYIRVMHVSGPAPPGVSGGPWLNQAGDIIGIQSGLMHSAGKPVGVAYMSPLEPIRTLIARRADRPTVTMGVGFEELWEQPSHVVRQHPDGQEGLVVSKVSADGPGAVAGLRIGEVVIAVDGRPVSYRDDLLKQVRRRSSGEAIRLKIKEVGGREREIVVKLGLL